MYPFVYTIIQIYITPDLQATPSLPFSTPISIVSCLEKQYLGFQKQVYTSLKSKGLTMLKILRSFSCPAVVEQPYLQNSSKRECKII
jgi:hypothetical protein